MRSFSGYVKAKSISHRMNISPVKHIKNLSLKLFLNTLAIILYFYNNFETYPYSWAIDFRAFTSGKLYPT